MVKLTAQAAGTPWPIRLGERLTAFGNLSLALLLALLTGRLMELSGVLVTTEVPSDVGMVILAALRSDLVLFLELLVFLLPLFLACRMILRGKNADVRVYGGLGSLVLIGAVALSSYFLFSRVPLGSDLFGYSLSDILTTARGGYHFTELSVATLLLPLAVFWVALRIFNRHPVLEARAALLLLGIAVPLTVVFLGVEGLGRAFSGPNAYLGSFTPFLDELAGQSLYFENFLASQGRTFASLPSILGSLPFAEQGFNSFGSRMPKSLTLLS